MAKSAQGATHISSVKATREDFDTVAQHHRHAISEPCGEPGGVDIDDLDGVTAAPRLLDDHGFDLVTQQARSTGNKQQVAHRSTVSPVRPGTTIAILVLLALLLAAGVIFVIRLNSVT